MEVILIIVAIYIIGCFFEKSDYDRMKEGEKLPSFTKEEAERYYYTELKSKQRKPNPYQLIWYKQGWSTNRVKKNNSKYWEWEIVHNGFKCP